MARHEKAESLGLPCAPEIERFLLGAILLNNASLPEIAASLTAGDFAITVNQTIFSRILDMREQGIGIDRATIAEELNRCGSLQAVGGLSYLVSLDAGLPDLPHHHEYVRVILEKSAARKAIRQAQKVIDRAMLGQDGIEQIASDGAAQLRDVAGFLSKGGGAKTAADVVAGYPGGVGDFLDPSRRPKGLQTGYRRLDDLTGGFYPGQLIIIAARPGCGKSSLSMNIAQNIVLSPDPKPVVVFSLEMSGASLLSRVMCAVARVDSHKFKHGYVNPEERRKLQESLYQLVESPLYIDDTAGLSAPRLAAAVKKLNDATGGLGLVIVDYLGLMDGGKAENETVSISRITRATKILANEERVPLVVLSQLSRATETSGNGVPQLHHLRSSGSIEQDADIVAFIYREELYKRDRADLKGIADLIVAKQRDGATGRLPLRFTGAYTRFDDREDNLVEPEGY